MHSVTSNAVAKCLAYSLTEQKTGETWVDGKPIYRLVLQGSISASQNWQEIADLSAYHIDIMVQMNGVFVQSANGYWIDIGNYASGLHYNLPSAKKLSLMTAWNGSYSIYLKYTKTTD